MRRLVLCALLASCAHSPGVLRPPAGPTEKTGVLVGNAVTPAGEPVLLVTVVVTGPALQGASSEFSDEAGAFAVRNLPPGRYDVLCIYGDVRAARHDVEVRVGEETRADCVVDPSKSGEVITIKERAGTIDGGSTTRGTTIAQDYMKNVPTRGRTWNGVLRELEKGDRHGNSLSGSTSVEDDVLAGEPTADELWIVARADKPRANAVGYGSGQLRRVGSAEVLLPLEHTDVHAKIVGYIASVDVRQRFTNPYAERIEAEYVFPLPANAAVSDFVMTIGDRRIRGVVRDRAEAQELYSEARAAGYTAALLTEERPNVFTQRVANLEPKKSIDVALTYFNSLPFEDGAYTFAFPMVVGPRYNPAGATGGVGAVGRGAAGASGQATEVQYLAPGEKSGHNVSLTVDIDAGTPLTGVSCASHAVDVADLPGGGRRVTLKAGAALPDRDFVLRYQLPAGPELFVHRDAQGQGTFALVLQPPASLAQVGRVPIELVFVVDVSGSMSGAPLDRARRTVSRTLGMLGPEDTFQIVLFADRAASLAPRPLRATAANVARGAAFLGQIQGAGGTEMLAGIQTALDAARDPERPRVVSFLTDGYIGNEAEILGAVHAKLGSTRIFSFGVGTSVNRYLLERMAIMGRGAAAFVDLGNDSADAAVDGFYQRVAHPALDDVEIDWGGMAVTDVYPRRIPDLLVGRPVVITGRVTGKLAGRVVVRGRAGGKPVEYSIPVGDGVVRDHAALEKVWARMRISELEDRATYEADRQGIAREIKATALQHGLMSAMTAFIAVDASEKTRGDGLTTVPVAVPVPAGVKYETTVGR